MRGLVFIFIISGFFIGCNSARKTIEPTAKSKALEAMIANKEFIIESDWMYPQPTSSMNAIANSGLLPPGSTTNNISLIGNPNSLKVHGDSITLDLPFYGERRLSSGQYGGNNGGIVFKGIPDRYEVTKDEKRQRHIIKFTVKNNSESYQGIITLYPNWNSNIVINSTYLTTVQYKGMVSGLEADDAVVTN